MIKPVSGIGHLTAIYIICCTNNFASKPSGKQLGCYAGVVPFGNSSGTSIKGKNKVHKMANKDLKKCYIYAHLSLSNTHPNSSNILTVKKRKVKMECWY